MARIFGLIRDSSSKNSFSSNPLSLNHPKPFTFSVSYSGTQNQPNSIWRSDRFAVNDGELIQWLEEDLKFPALEKGTF
jgi:hypothetical protein